MLGGCTHDPTTSNRAFFLILVLVGPNRVDNKSQCMVLGYSFPRWVVAMTYIIHKIPLHAIIAWLWASIIRNQRSIFSNCFVSHQLGT